MIDFFINHIPLKFRIVLAYFLFGSVSLIIVLVAQFGFSQTTTEFLRFSHFSQQAQLSLQLANHISDMQRSADSFTNTGKATDAEQVLNAYETVSRLIEEILDQPDLISSSHVHVINKRLEAYIEAFKELRRQRNLQSNLVEVSIRQFANDAEKQINEYLSQSATANQIRRNRALDVLNSLLLVEKHAFRYFDTLNAQYVTLAKDNFQTALTHLKQLILWEDDRAAKDRLFSLGEIIGRYQNSFLEAVQRTRGYLYLVNVVLAAEAYEIYYQSKQIQDLYARTMQEIEQQILASVQQVTQLVILVGFGLFIIAAVLSYVIGRSITRPILHLADTFKALSGGSSIADIPLYPLDDEIGALSNAAEVFREKNNETRHLLQKYQDLSGDLEIKVDERTKQLAASNQELITAKEAAEAAARAKSDFLANMSHEIRTPMHAIIGMNYLIQQTPLDKTQQSYTENIDLSANALLRLINDILDYSKIEAGKLQIEHIEFDLHAVIENVAIVVGSKVSEHHLGFNIDYAPSLPRYFMGDPMRLSQVLTNLLNNAAKFTEKGEIGLNIAQGSNSCIQFCVWDTGIGIAPEVKQRLFQTFSQADESTTRRYGGTGLGLAISKQLVELMQGSITVESEIGKGSRFCFEIGLEPVTSDPPVPRLLDGKRVLLVEQSQATRTTLNRLAETMGLEVLATDSATQALETLDQQPVDLAIVNWSLPDQRGIDLVQEIHNSHPQMERYILLTPLLYSHALQAEARTHGVDTFLPKPVNPSRFYNVLLQAFGAQMNSHYLSVAHSDELKNQLPRLRGNTILLVDDNPMNQQIIHGLLQDSGIGLQDASNGEEAVKTYLAEPDRYQLILMDIQMPEVDGYAATARIREHDSEVPIIALTADALVSDMEKTRAYGMNEHLNKPIEIEKLFSLLLRYLPATNQPRHSVSDTNVDLSVASPKLKMLNTIDVGAGINRVQGDESLYLALLRSFFEHYRDSQQDFQNLPPEADSETRQLVHALKGNAGSIGATRLFDLASRLNANYQVSLLDELRSELSRVIEDLRAAGLTEATVKFIPHDEDTADVQALFNELAEALKRRRPKAIDPIMEKLVMAKLDIADAELRNELRDLLKKYRYVEALNLLQKRK